MMRPNVGRSVRRFKIPKEKIVLSATSLRAHKEPYNVRLFIKLLFSVVALIVYFSLEVVTDADHTTSALTAKSLISSSQSTQPGSPPSNDNGKGVSLVAACQNTHEQLRKSLPLWLKVIGINEIILIDWASTPPLSYVVEELDKMSKTHPPIYVIHIRNEEKWASSKVYNVGFHASHYSFILQVKCDHSVHSNFIEHHPLNHGEFYVGGQHLERSKDEEDLRSVLYIEKESLLQIGGYDERIQEYGGEQKDLTSRLIKAGRLQKDINYNKISHGAHSNDSVHFKSEEEKVLEELKMKINIDLLKSIPPWNRTLAETFQRNSGFKANRDIIMDSFRHENVHYLVRNATFNVPSITSLVSKSEFLSMKDNALGRFLSDRFFLTKCISNQLTISSKYVLLKTLVEKSLETVGRPVPNTLIIHCVNSLSSRLGLLASGLSFSKATGRKLIVLWNKRDGSKQQSFSSIFLDSKNYLALDRIQNSTVKRKKECVKKGVKGSTFFLTYYMGSESSEPSISNVSENHMYIKTDAALRTNNLRVVNSKLIRFNFLNLPFHPDVVREFESLKERGLSNALGFYLKKPLQEGKLHQDNLHAYTAVIESIETFRTQHGTSPKVYLYGADSIRERLQDGNVEVFDSLEPQLKPTSKEYELTFKEELIHILALTHTYEFTTLYNDSLSTFVQLIRGESEAYKR